MKLTYARPKGSKEALPQMPAGSVKFLCPNCKEYEILRTLRARKMAVKYKCPGCEFEGPN